MTGHYAGLLYRALNPVYARDPLSGRGAALHGGRFNRKGTPALYTSLSPLTAVREANQVGDLGPVFDTRDPTALAARGITAADLADTRWRARMIAGEPVPTQDLAAALAADGYVGLLVRSFAPGTTDTDLNLVLWRWSGPGLRLDVIDDEGRLG